MPSAQTLAAEEEGPSGSIATAVFRFISRYAGRNENFVPVVLTSAFDSTMPSAYAAAILTPDS
jgi:hypothetical protein